MNLAADHQRIDALDVLRGLALFGVLTVNLITAFRVSIFAQFLPPEAAAGLLDSVVAGFVRHALELKAFAIFSMLFGVGLGIQYQQLAKTGRPLYWLARRMLVLLGLGLVHLLLIWNGDILVEYAFAGLLIVPLLGARAWVLAAGSGLMFALYLLFPVVAWPEAGWIQQHVVTATQVYSTGSYFQILKFSIAEIAYLIPLHVAVFPRTLAFFLLGAWIWRTGVLREVGAHKGLLLWSAATGMGGGAALALAGAANAATILLAIGFGAVVVALTAFSGARRVMGVFAPLGRMAFTNYIMQSLVFAWVFFGYGLGQFGQHEPAIAFVFGGGLFGLQCVASAWWLRRYRFGPLEWLWRTLMYGRRQPMAR